MVDFDLKQVSNKDLQSELEFLVLDKKKLLRQVDDLDTKIIGIKEEQRRRKEKLQEEDSISNQDADDTSF